jgi:hypothetical protein
MLPFGDTEQNKQLETPEKVPFPVKDTVAALTGAVSDAANRLAMANLITFFICPPHNNGCIINTPKISWWIIEVNASAQFNRG